MIRHTFKSIASCILFTMGSTTLQAQTASVNAICSTDGPWCELAAKEFTRQTGIKVFQTHKATGEAQAQLRAGHFGYQRRRRLQVVAERGPRLELQGDADAVLSRFQGHLGK